MFQYTTGTFTANENSFFPSFKYVPLNLPKQSRINDEFQPNAGKNYVLYNDRFSSIKWRANYQYFFLEFPEMYPQYFVKWIYSIHPYNEVPIGQLHFST